MSLTLAYWPLALLAVLGIAAGAWWWRRRGLPRPARDRDARLTAGTARLRATDRYRRLASRALRRALATLVSVCLLVAGSVLMVGRLADASTSSSTMHNRDIMLCLDVSGSMHEVDAAMLRAFADIVGGLRGERVGLTMWNSSAVSLFPLTDDYTFMAQQLSLAADRVDAGDQDFLAGTSAGHGSSLIGDGVVSCLQRFDRLDEPRARTMVLATDNDLSGKPIHRLPEAFDLVTARGVVVHGIAEDDSPDIAALRVQVARTQGQMYLLGDGGTAAGVIASISAQDASRLEGVPRARVADLPLVGGLLAGLGVLGLAVAQPPRRPTAAGGRR